MNLAEPHSQQTVLSTDLSYKFFLSIYSPWDVTLKKARIELECCLLSRKNLGSSAGPTTP